MRVGDVPDMATLSFWSAVDANIRKNLPSRDARVRASA